MCTFMVDLNDVLSCLTFAHAGSMTNAEFSDSVVLDSYHVNTSVCEERNRHVVPKYCSIRTTVYKATDGVGIGIEVHT